MTPETFCLGAFLHGACLGLGAVAPAPPSATVVVCPPLAEWSATEQARAGQALAALPAGHPLRRLAAVTVKQRDLVKRCQAEKGRGG
jgi:hypothetical protein